MRNQKMLILVSVMLISSVSLGCIKSDGKPVEESEPIKPYYLTEEYVEMKRAEEDQAQQEAEHLRASIEEYQERQQAEAERQFKENQIETDEDPEIYEMANCVEAEAGNQDDLGKRYVADVILNRVDDPDFPDTIHGVISQKYQFSSFWDGGMDKWKPTEEAIRICREELEARTNTSLLFFTAGEFNPYGTPAFIHGDHYFSTK